MPSGDRDRCPIIAETDRGLCDRTQTRPIVAAAHNDVESVTLTTSDWASRADGLFDEVWTAPVSVERSVRTHELIEATAAIREAYAPHQLTVRRRPDDFDLRLHRAACDSVQLTEFSVGADVELFVPPVGNFYLLILPLAGHSTIGTQGESVVLAENVGAITNTRQSYYFEDFSSDCRYACLRIEKSRLERTFANLTKRPIDNCLEFAFRVDLARPSAAPIVRAIELLASELGDHSGAVSPLLSKGIAQHVVNAVLLHQPHNYANLLDLSVEDVPSALRDAQEFMHRHLGEDITVTDIARAASVSVRTLEDIFQRTLHSSPMTTLRHMRLARAHDELNSAPAHSTTVAEIARRSGFRHQGRFAIEYRRAYGVSPSEELRSAR